MNALDLVLLVVVGVVISSLVVLVINAIERNKDAKYLAMLEEAYAMNDAHDDDNWFRQEAEDHYAADVEEYRAACESYPSVVPVVGYCLCNKPYNFTTTSASAQDIKFLDMIACSHCSVCNPTIEVVDEQIDGERVTFTFSDGSTAVMREHKGWGSTRHLDAPSEGGYHVRLDNDSQMDAINRYTGSECIPF
jgi:hypothetical protein